MMRDIEHPAMVKHGIGWAHAAVEGANSLLHQHRFTPAQIEAIEIVTFKEAAAGS